jgi:hypothetical protein
MNFLVVEWSLSLQEHFYNTIILACLNSFGILDIISFLISSSKALKDSEGSGKKNYLIL